MLGLLRRHILFSPLMARSHNLSTSSRPHVLIAGLGNAPYPSTRHSIGQYIVSALSAHLSIPLSSTRGGQIGSNSSGTISLFKSKHLMNVSGPSVVNAMRSSGTPPSHLILIYDSIAHAPCKVSVRLGGSAQGHNGVKSVMQSLGASATSKPFWQFRVGVGRGHSTVDPYASSKRSIDKTVDAAHWVLGPLSEEEKAYWGVGGKGLEQILREIDRIVEELNEDPSG